MSLKKPSRLRRFAGFVLFRMIPAILVVGILWSSVQVAQAVVRRINEQGQADQRASAYGQTASAVAPTLNTFTPTNSDTATFTLSPTSTVTSSATATATASATSTASATATASASPTIAPTATPIPPTATPLTIAQAFFTNTPRPPSWSGITLPAVNTPIPANTVEPTSTDTETATLAPTATLVPSTATVAPSPAEQVTPPPLPTLFVPNDPDPNQVAVTGIPTAVTAVDRHGDDLVNILLLGKDDQITNDNFGRTDTMIILSINRTTGTVSMLSLPRDLFVYVPGWTMERLNLAYIHGETVGWTGGGFGLLRQTIFYNFGINVHFYAIVNLSGFKQIVDTLGGIDLAVDCAIEDYPLVDSELPTGAQQVSADGLYVVPVGYYHMDGAQALWYSRSRHSSIEFDRGRRQQQVLRAIWRKALSTGQLANLPTLWNEGTQIVQTNLGFQDMLSLLPIALNLDPSRIESFTFTRLYQTTPWQTPDGQDVQIPIYDTIRPMLEDFYTPPTENQIVSNQARIAVYNGTSNPDWDRVAAESLAWDGFNAVASGPADNTNYTDTVLTDYTGQSKGSSLNDIATALNVNPQNIVVQPDPNRQTDFSVIVGSNYSSCSAPGVSPVSTPQGG